MNRKVSHSTAFVSLLLFLVFSGTVLLWIVDAAPVHMPHLAPDNSHVLGTDSSGRDILLLTLRAAGTSLTIGFCAALGATFIGASIGCLAGYRRGWADDVLMRLTDVFLLVPALPLVIVLVTYLGPGVFNVIFLIALTAWPSTARVVRARVLALREQPFIMNARSMGAGTPYLIMRHIMPNCSEILLAKASLAVAAALLAEAGISFLGLGDPRHSSWGSILHDAFSGGALINGVWWWFMPSLVCIALSVVLFHLVGHAFADKSALALSVPDLRSQVGAEDGIGLEKYDRRIPALLSIKGLRVNFDEPRPNGGAVVRGLDLTLSLGEKVAIIGATGSGKSLLLLAILGLLPASAKVEGRIQFEGRDLNTLDARQLRRYRGVSAGYIPQGVGEAFNPVLTIGRQAAERIQCHYSTSRRVALQEVADRLSSLRFAEPERLIKAYPHHLSGGMKQRALIAMAMAGRPRLLLADEPTKGLDPKSIAGVIECFKRLTNESVLAVTHDLEFAEALDGRVVVLQDGLVVEQCGVELFFDEPLHPYSRELLDAHNTLGIGDRKGGRGGPGLPEGVGCGFRLQCQMADEACRQDPPWIERNGRGVRCWRYAT